MDDGTSILDYDPEEVRRQITINTAIAPIEWNNHKINVLDTPGYFDFVGEVIAAGRVADSALIVVCASSGVEVGTEKAWEYADAAELPRMIFINKMDRENADFDKVVDQLREFFGPKVVPVQLPMGNAQDFSGIIDLVKGKAFGKDGKEMAIPGDLQDAVDAARDALMEAVSVADDELMMKYLEGEPLTDEEIGEALRLGTKSGDVVPVFCGSAAQGAGINLLLDHIVSCAPSPVERKAEGTLKGEAIAVNTDDAALCAQVFKTMADPYVGKLTLFRVFSGTIKSDSTVFNTRSGKDERIGQLFVIKARNRSL